MEQQIKIIAASLMDYWCQMSTPFGHETAG